MASPILPDTIQCSQCGGELHPDEGQTFVTCPFCSSTVYLDKSQVVFHWYLAPTLDEAQARSALARWMAGNDTVKDLDRKSRLVEESFQYFPFWYFKYSSAGRDRIVLEPAAAISVTELRHLRLPAGDLRKYDPSVDPSAARPTVPLEAAREWLRQDSHIAKEVLESALVHIPVYSYKYMYQNQVYTAVVDGATGETFANIFPAKAEAPYRSVGCVTAGVFLSLALIPVILGLAAGDGAGAVTGLFICSGFGIPAAAILFAVASWVAAKV